VKSFVAAAQKLVLGDGMDESATLSPLISAEQRDRVVGWIDRGVKEGATLVLDGRDKKVAARPNGNFVGPTIFDSVQPEMAIAREEVFGPVVAVVRARDLSEAIDISNFSRYG